MLKLKDFLFSLWLVLQPCIFLYEKEGTGFGVLGTGSLKRQLFHASLCPSGHVCLY